MFGFGKSKNDDREFEVDELTLSNPFTIQCKAGCSLTVDPTSNIGTVVKGPDGEVLHEEEWSKWSTSPVLCMNHLFDSGIVEDAANAFSLTDTVVELSNGFKMYSCSGEKEKDSAPGSCLRIEDSSGKELFRAHADDWAKDPKRFWAYVYEKMSRHM